MENKKVNINVGGGFSGMLTIAFIVLKLCGVIDWAWIWVLAPIWMTAALVLAIVLIYMVVALIAALIASKIY